MVFCLAEYAEALPSIVAILLKWAVAVGFMAAKRVDWLNSITGEHAGRTAHEALDRALGLAGADVLLRAEIPVRVDVPHTTGSLAGPTKPEPGRRSAPATQ